jgi:hypothetical protein
MLRGAPKATPLGEQCILNEFVRVNLRLEKSPDKRFVQTSSHALCNRGANDFFFPPLIFNGAMAVPLCKRYLSCNLDPVRRCVNQGSELLCRAQVPGLATARNERTCTQKIQNNANDLHYLLRLD